MDMAKFVHIARSAAVCLAAGFFTTLSGCADVRYFVDGDLKDVSVSQIARLQHPRATQLLFSFKTRGLVNATTSEILEDDITRIVASSELFSAVSSGPAPGGAILSVEIDAIPGTQRELARGLTSGLTLGLTGSTRTDPFVCTVDYIASPGGTKLTTTAQHAIYIPMGIIDSRPKNIVMARNRLDALHTVARQVVTAALQQLSNDPEFRKEAEAP